MNEIDAWCMATGKSMRDLMMADNAFMIRKNLKWEHEVKFIKCRDPQKVLDWCRMQWGRSNYYGTWELKEYLPYLIIRGEENLNLFRMVWE